MGINRFSKDMSLVSQAIDNDILMIKRYDKYHSIETKTIKNFLIKDIATFEAIIVTSLPTVGQNQIMYLISTGSNNYDKYIWINSIQDFEKIGTTNIDFSEKINTVAGLNNIHAVFSTDGNLHGGSIRDTGSPATNMIDIQGDVFVGIGQSQYQTGTKWLNIGTNNLTIKATHDTSSLSIFQNLTELYYPQGDGSFSEAISINPYFLRLYYPNYHEKALDIDQNMIKLYHNNGSEFIKSDMNMSTTCIGMYTPQGNAMMEYQISPMSYRYSLNPFGADDDLLYSIQDQSGAYLSINLSTLQQTTGDSVFQTYMSADGQTSYTLLNRPNQGDPILECYNSPQYIRNRVGEFGNGDNLLVSLQWLNFGGQTGDSLVRLYCPNGDPLLAGEKIGNEYRTGIYFYNLGDKILDYSSNWQTGVSEMRMSMPNGNDRIMGAEVNPIQNKLGLYFSDDEMLYWRSDKVNQYREIWAGYTGDTFLRIRQAQKWWEQPYDYSQDLEFGMIGETPFMIAQMSGGLATKRNYVRLACPDDTSYYLEVNDKGIEMQGDFGKMTFVGINTNGQNKEIIFEIEGNEYKVIGSPN